MTDKPKTRLCAIELDATIGPGPSPEAEHERRVAIYDLVEENSFTLLANPQGPYRLKLSTADGRVALTRRLQATPGSNRWEIETAELPVGLYYARLLSRDGVSPILKVVKKP